MELDTGKIIKDIWICERKYTISMLQSEEASFDNIIAVILEQINSMRKKFPALEDKDFLAMALIQVATRDISHDPEEMDSLEAEGKIHKLIHFLEENITNNSNSESEL